MINLNHPVCVMANHIDWEKADRIILDWFDSDLGRPAKPTRLIAGLFLLKQMFNVSDEDLPERWVENPYWQYFCGENFFQHEFPIHPTSMSKWRRRMSEESAEQLLSLSIDLGLKTKTVKRSDFNRVSVDTTVQEKAVSYPTDAKLCEKAIQTLGKLAKQHKLNLKQSYKHVAKKALFKVNNYARANQHKRKRRHMKQLKTYLGRLQRDVERQLEGTPALKGAFSDILSKVSKLMTQEKTSKGKLYSLHAPEVECIAKGKTAKRYEFGVKVSVVATQKRNFIIGTQALAGTPYDGHTLVSALDQAEKLSGKRAQHSFVDNGYKGHSEEKSEVHVARKKSTYATVWLKKCMRGRNAIEALFSHAKRDGQLRRNYLKGSHGDKLNALLSSVGYNLRLILAEIKLFCLYKKWYCYVLSTIIWTVNVLMDWMGSLVYPEKTIVQV
jgi:IS5 family transposase